MTKVAPVVRPGRGLKPRLRNQRTSFLQVAPVVRPGRGLKPRDQRAAAAAGGRPGGETGARIETASWPNSPAFPKCRPGGETGARIETRRARPLPGPAR